MKRKLLFSALALLVLIPRPAQAWNDHGHRVIASIAFQKMAPDVRLEVANKIRKHPRWDQDFESKMPDIVRAGDAQVQAEWIFQQACVWPDIARGFRGEDRKYNHGNWHWADLVYDLNSGESSIRDEKYGVNQSTSPPESASEDMNPIQRISYAKQRITGEVAATGEEISLMYCWFLHSYSDIHQPCHSTAMFSSKLFPKGDRGSNLIPTKQSRNLHALWDGLLGSDRGFESCRNEAAKRIEDGDKDSEKAALSLGSANDVDAIWEASHAHGVATVYGGEVLKHIQRSEQAGATELQEIDLSASYLKNSGDKASKQAFIAGCRIASLLAWKRGE